MDAHSHLVLLAVLAVYTVVLVVLVARNVRALRTHHACTDVSSPLCRTLTSLMEQQETRPNVYTALAAANFHAVHVLIFDKNGDVLFDTDGSVSAKASPPTDTQREVKAAFEAGAKTRLVHRPEGSQMAHVVGSTCKDGTTVLVEALAV